jgi:hypothetical protein
MRLIWGGEKPLLLWEHNHIALIYYWHPVLLMCICVYLYIPHEYFYKLHEGCVAGPVTVMPSNYKLAWRSSLKPCGLEGNLEAIVGAIQFTPPFSVSKRSKGGERLKL